MKGSSSKRRGGALASLVVDMKHNKKRKGRSCSSSIAMKPKKDEETQRLIHINLERNRRKQMKGHLDVLRTLMPASYLQRGDHASIIGGAIEFVKDLESVLKTLQGLYRERTCANYEMSNSCDLGKKATNIIPSSPIMGTTDFSTMLESMSSSLFNDMDILNANTIPFYDMYLNEGEKKGEIFCMEEGHAWDGDDMRCRMRDVEVEMRREVVQGLHNCALMKVIMPWRRSHGHLLYALVSIIEKQLHFHILHLYINTMDQVLIYSFYLQIENGTSFCGVQEIATCIQHLMSISYHGNAFF